MKCLAAAKASDSWSPTGVRRSRPTLCLWASSSLHLQEYSSPGSPSGWSVDFPAGNRNTVGAVYEGVNELQVKGKVPSSAEEGWMRDQEKCAKPPEFAADGVVLIKFNSNSLDQHHPVRANKVASHFFFMSRPPLLSS